MKNIIRKITEGVGIGIGVSLAIFVAVLIFEYIDRNQYDDFTIPETIFQADKLVSGLDPDVTHTDAELMELFSGEWYGITWLAGENTLYDYSWNGTPEGHFALKFNYYNKDEDDYVTEKQGTWWVKLPYFHYESPEGENTYRILYYDSEHMVYQGIVHDGDTVPIGRIFVRTKRK